MLPLDKNNLKRSIVMHKIIESVNSTRIFMLHVIIISRSSICIRFQVKNQTIVRSIVCVHVLVMLMGLYDILQNHLTSDLGL